MIRHVEGSRERTRVVERFTRLGAPLGFRALCEQVVPRDTRFVVFDLDRTLHLGRNMGELLGWEICAYLSYGRHYLDVLERGRVGGRVYLEKRKPWGALRYMRLAASHWIPPGLFYLLWGKIASRVQAVRRRAYLRFGPEPVRAVQSIPQHALLHRIAALPLPLVRELAARVWRRYQQDQTVEREDIEWLRGLVTRLTDHFERPFEQRWEVADAPEKYLEGQLRAIKGMELRIHSIEAKAKHSQNRPAADRDGVIAGLRAVGDHDGAGAVAHFAPR